MDNLESNSQQNQKTKISSGRIFGGIVLVALGAIFLGQNMGWFQFEWNLFGPAMMIILGLVLIFRPRSR